jgi:hypothetical protein
VGRRLRLGHGRGDAFGDGRQRVAWCLKGWANPYYFTGFIRDIGTRTRIDDTSQDKNTYLSWAAAFQRYVADKGNTNDPTLRVYPPPWDGASIMQTQSGAGYFLWRQSTLHLAAGLGIAGARSRDCMD